MINYFDYNDGLISIVFDKEDDYEISILAFFNGRPVIHSETELEASVYTRRVAIKPDTLKIRDSKNNMTQIILV